MPVKTKVKIDIILSTTISFSFIAFLAFCLIFGKEEGTIGKGIIINFIADYIGYLFPIVLLSSDIPNGHPSILFLFTTFNILLYSFILVKLFTSKLLKRKKYTPYSLTVITAYIIPSIILLHVIYLIYNA